MAPGVNAAKKEDGGLSGNVGLDDISKTNLNGGPGASTVGSGIFGSGGGGGGGGGGLPGGFPGSVTGTGTVPSTGGTDGTTVASNTPPGIGQSEHPGTSLEGSFTISVDLFADPDQGGGDCNQWRGAPQQQMVCEKIRISENGSPQPRCQLLTVPGPIDPALIPKVEFKADRPFYRSSQDIYQKTFSADCSASGDWVASTGLIKVPIDSSPQDQDRNLFNFQVEAFYPKDGAWLSRGTETISMKCGDGGPGDPSCVKVDPRLQPLAIQPEKQQVLSQ